MIESFPVILKSDNPKKQAAPENIILSNIKMDIEQFRAMSPNCEPPAKIFVTDHLYAVLRRYAYRALIFEDGHEFGKATLFGLKVETYYPDNRELLEYHLAPAGKKFTI